jgi:dTDP-4-dehydrorhamnose 3,5-epimerase-like enzyme
MSIHDVRLIPLPKIADSRGNLTFIENEGAIPFAIQRVYYLYDVPGGATRAGHALKTTRQLIIAATGSFDVVLDDGQETRSFTLNRSYYGLYVPTYVWRVLENFSSGAVSLCLVSTKYDPDDYFRDYSDFKAAVAQRQLQP